MSAQRSKHKKRPKHWHRRDEHLRWVAVQQGWPTTHVDVDATDPELTPIKGKSRPNKGEAA